MHYENWAAHPNAAGNSTIGLSTATTAAYSRIRRWAKRWDETVPGDGRAKVVDLDHDIMLRYEFLGTYPASRDFAWRMCRQVETESGHGIRLGTDVELWLPDSAAQESVVGGST